MNQPDYSKIEVYLDSNQEAIASYSPPAQMELDTSKLDDGEHTIKFVAIDTGNKRSIKKINFVVRNGPGITVYGLKDNDVVEGKLHLLLNSYGGAYMEKWEPARAETPAPIPTWTWIVFIGIVVWSMYYFIDQWSPTGSFAETPTYQNIRHEETNEANNIKTIGISGSEVYRKSCSSCHQENGQGVPNVFPPLAGNLVVNDNDPSKHIRTVLFGLQGETINGTLYNTPMPGWAEQLSNEELAAVINHERSSWGNNGRMVTPEEVRKVREEGK